MNYNLKEKIEVNEEFLTDLIAKSWQESEAIQQQAANIDTSTKLGAEVARLLKNACTNYYVLIGCLEALTESTSIDCYNTCNKIDVDMPQIVDEPDKLEAEQELESESEDSLIPTMNNELNAEFEPFEYFVDFDEPAGAPLTDDDLYKI